MAEATWDANDTTTLDPTTDGDVSGLFARHLRGAAFTSWHDARELGGLGPAEQRAAALASAHGDTPTVAILDPLGRTVLTLSHNRFERDGTTFDESYPLRIDLDIEANTRVIHDAIADAADPTGRRAVMRYDFDLIGRRLCQASVDAGRRWMLPDVVGSPIHSWDGLGRHRSEEYDPARRRVRSRFEGGPENPPSPVLFEVAEYGESHATAEQFNLRGRLWQRFDGAGLATNDQYDFKGNVIRSSRRFASDYRRAPDWSTDRPGKLEQEQFTSRSWYDALNRTIQVVPPHSSRTSTSVVRVVYTEAGLLRAEYIWLQQAAEPAEHELLDLTTATRQPITDVRYDARGRRAAISYDNGTRTQHRYDNETFRLENLTTTRPPGRNGSSAQLFRDPETVQALTFTYDAVGNVSQIDDGALKRIVFGGQVVRPASYYEHDAVYRLIEAAGREHVGQCSYAPRRRDLRSYPFVGPGPAPGDTNAFRNYTERYAYDAVGNIAFVHHHATGGAWTRRHEYGPGSNRLASTSLPGDADVGPFSAAYEHNAHGDIVKMLNLVRLDWDLNDQLYASARQRRTGGEPETTYYVYDADGHRVRKVTDAAPVGNASPAARYERIYLAGCELYRNYGVGDTLERETLHVMDADRRVAMIESVTARRSAAVTPPIPHYRYQLTDHLGSVSLELDDGAQLVSYEEYHPYGTSAYQLAVTNAEVSAKRFRYSARERDTETGFTYHLTRFYVPWLGRWTSCDRAGMVEGPNLFVYARCNPISLSDPSGTGMPDEPPKAKANDIVRYDESLAGRVDEGLHNPQKDHFPNQAKQRVINPNVKTSDQLTIVQETGAATAEGPAKPHTKATFHGPKADVPETARLKAMSPADWQGKSFYEEFLLPGLEWRYACGYAESPTNIVGTATVGALFEIDQPNRAPNSSFPTLDYQTKLSDPRVTRGLDAVKPFDPSNPNIPAAIETANTANAQQTAKLDTLPTFEEAGPKVGEAPVEFGAYLVMGADTIFNNWRASVFEDALTKFPPEWSAAEYGVLDDMRVEVHESIFSPSGWQIRVAPEVIGGVTVSPGTAWSNYWPAPSKRVELPDYAKGGTGSW